MVGSLFLASCQKEENESTPVLSANGNSIEDLNVESNFDWKTSQEVTFEIQSKDDAVISIQSIDGGTYEKGFVKANSTYSTKITLPKETETIVLNFNNRLFEVSVKEAIEFTYNQ